MKKECTCKKILKEDKATLITECWLCKKNRRKELKLAIKLLEIILELKKITIPKYTKRGKENGKENFFVVYPNGNKEQISPPINFEKDGNYCFVKDENIETDIEKYFKYLSEQQKQAKEQ